MSPSQLDEYDRKRDPKRTPEPFTSKRGRAKDPIFVIKAKEIIETLEATTDAGEDIAIVLERIILKNQ